MFFWNSFGFLMIHMQIHIHIMRNTGMEEAQAGIKIAGRNINNPRYADDTILMAESEKELKSLLMNLKEESEKAGLKLNIQKKKILASSPIIAYRWGNNGNSEIFHFGGGVLQSHSRCYCSHEIKRRLLLGRKSYDQPRQHIKKQRHYFCQHRSKLWFFQ